MKVVLFCGGFGMRMRDDVDDVPKPMQMVGDRPLIWHVMRYYAHFGYTDFVLCLGYGARHIVDFFRSYDETRSNDFVLRKGATEVELLSSDIADWTITFVHTGLDTPIGERLRRVREHVGSEEAFAANYADVLTDAPLDEIERRFRASGAIGSLLAVPPQSAFHMVAADAEGLVDAITSVSSLPVRENGGYFFFRREIFDHLHEGEDLVTHALPRLIEKRALLAYPHDGFWKPADTVKERSELDQLARRHERPWALWAEGHPAAAPGRR
ncbi:glucose-1-phosphate cytidylyltransferase [Blastococcus saxobsidens]|uniref:Putative sugar-phosphate nucleotidyltransferase putative glucose-1-phosphate cytidylyltransferase (CDP-glucose pyrophosphorylase) n=1 Tax=Blastococcus saxobsidens (strain DD2) TaxID=1146883 RepID=H6RN17_BLASD|nr:glucose-1-phosphate cytidylyltransferase [Blastococcus saxobsidens]CCG01370.1 putative sugar-phosphate nucleotidyltransferase; putative glucose-1-phosphate cytidylyltransferase (CDP-glucose pyrophosphorylase) [Blastococcus saxobsidens DD2]